MEFLIALVVISIAAGAIAQAVTGMGFSLVSAPALLAFLGPREGVAVVVILAAMSSVFPLSRQWRAVRLGSAGALHWACGLSPQATTEPSLRRASVK
mgnify:CR=1 FL=1